MNKRKPLIRNMIKKKGPRAGKPPHPLTKPATSSQLSLWFSKLVLLDVIIDSKSPEVVELLQRRFKGWRKRRETWPGLSTLDSVSQRHPDGPLCLLEAFNKQKFPDGIHPMPRSESMNHHHPTYSALPAAPIHLLGARLHTSCSKLRHTTCWSTWGPTAMLHPHPTLSSGNLICNVTLVFLGLVNSTWSLLPQIHLLWGPIPFFPFHHLSKNYRGSSFTLFFPFFPFFHW